MRKKHEFIICLIAIFLSYGFIMEFQWPWLAKKESQKKEEKKSALQVSNPKNENKESKSRMPAADFFSKKPSEKSDSKKLVSTERKSQSKVSDLPQGGSGAGPLAGQAEIAKLQADIQQIAEQTKTIEAQSEIDRLRIQKIAEQAKIQQQLMRSLQVPKITTTNQVVNPEETLRATKVRLIAEEVKQTQQALRSIQTANQATSVVRTTQIQKAPKKVQS